MVAFAERLRRLRQERFLTQAELAERAGLTKLTISRLEAGRAAPHARTVRKLAAALGVEPGDLARPEDVST
jgi:transcriptional regulator with XRE-family HTH domain